jgi:hypothetical protein
MSLSMSAASDGTCQLSEPMVADGEANEWNLLHAVSVPDLRPAGRGPSCL